MKIGVIKEIKTKEGRVGLTPACVAALIADGHQVRVESEAGLGSGFSDADYRAASAEIVATAQAWDNELVVKVKEPLAAEYGFLRDQIVFTYFHLAGAPQELTEALLAGKTSAVAYETLENADGRLPLLAPMSAIAGNMAVQMGSHYLAAHHGGKGVMLGSVLGERHGNVTIIGDGVVGRHAAATAIGQGANVAVAGLTRESGEHLRREISADIDFFISTPAAIAERLGETDLLVGAVLAHGERARHVVSEAMVKILRPGSVIVDVSIDQGGCIETARPTSHAEPIYVEHGVIHYCVTNMPGAYPHTSTLALTNVTLPYARKLAANGLNALAADAGFAKALNTHQGYITYKSVAEAFGTPERYRDWTAAGF